MSSQQHKRLLAIGGGVAVLALAGWFGASYVATQRAESAIVDLLTRHDLRDSVTWGSLSASPLGTVTLRDVAVGKPGADQGLTVERVQVSDVKDDAERKRASAQLRGVVTREGNSPLADLDVVRAGGRTTLPPLDADIAWDLNVPSGEGRFTLRVDQPEAMRADVDATFAGLGKLVSLATAGDVGKDELSGLGLFGAMEMLSSIALVKARVELRDQGHVERSIALLKRYTYTLDPAGASPNQQRKDAFQAAIDKEVVDCPSAFSQFDAAASCGPLIAFLGGKSGTLIAQANPATPVVLGKAIPQWFMESPRPVMRQLNVTTSN